MLQCIGCKKKPHEIKEYQTGAKMDGITPEQFVRTYENIGVWGPKHGPEAFYCTECYIAAGMPIMKPGR